MSLGRAVDAAIDKATGPGTISAETDGASADIDVLEADRLGVRVRGVRIVRAEDIDITDEAKALPDRLRSLPERLMPVEVDPGLGGAILRTEPSDVTDGEFYELEVRGPRELELKRFRAEPGKERDEADFTLTRKQLGKVVDELA
jgi:hypothetical protein